MPRIKTTAVKKRVKQAPTKAIVLKKVKNAAARAKELMMKGAGEGGTLIHTGKLKVPFKPATAVSIAKAKKGLLKQLKRRWRSGTVAKREIRKLSRTTHLLFPRRPFQRLVREIAQDYKDIRFTGASMQAIQEAAEIFVTETFHKADMARKHAKRHTLHMEDVRFSRFMTQESMWITPDKIWDKETFAVTPKQVQQAGAHTKAKASLPKPQKAPASVSAAAAAAASVAEVSDAEVLPVSQLALESSSSSQQQKNVQGGGEREEKAAKKKHRHGEGEKKDKKRKDREQAGSAGASSSSSASAAAAAGEGGHKKKKDNAGSSSKKHHKEKKHSSTEPSAEALPPSEEEQESQLFGKEADSASGEEEEEQREQEEDDQMTSDE